MVGSAPYQKACNACGKMIILGIDAENNKWRPWDNYATKEKHSCSARAVTSEKISTMGQTAETEIKIELAEINKKLEDIPMMMYSIEKIAKTVGAKLDESNG